MPAPRDLAAELARNTADLFADAEARLAAALARQVRQDIADEHADRLAGLAKVRQAAQAILARLDSRSRDAVQRAVLEAFAAGSRAAVDDLTRLGSDRWIDWLARRSRIVDAITRLLGIARRREMRLQEELAGLRTALPGIDAIMALIQELTQRLSSTHLRVLRWEQDAYRQVMAAPALDVLAGLKTRLRATQVAMDHLAAQGITAFTDKANRNWTLGSYAEMATRTTVAHAAIEGAVSQFRAAGVELVIVSNAPQECKLCRPWEGKILALVGGAGPRVMEHGIDDRLVTVPVEATLGEAVAQGLMHPNCRHSLAAYLPGVTRIPTGTEDPQGDADRQELRRLEREKRKAKRREAAALTPEARRKWHDKVRERDAQIRRHVKDTGLHRQRNREQLEHDDVNPPGPRVPLPPRERPSRARAPEPDPAPEPAEAVQPTVPEPSPRPTASDATRAKINAALADLPRDTEAWDAPVARRRRRIDQRLAEERAKLAEARAELERVTAEVQDEFRRKRTPRYKRPDILEERTWREQFEVRTLEDDIDYFERQLESGENDENRGLFEVETFYDYPTDEDGNRIAPDEWNAWLDHVMDVGGALAGDLERALASDEQLQGLQGDAARRARESEIVRDLLASVRPIGGHEQRLGTERGDVRDDWGSLVREGEQIYPLDWLRLADGRGPLRAEQSERAYYSPAFDTLGVPGGELPDYRTAFSSYDAEAVAHELGHRMESVVPGLTHLEYAMVLRQAMQDGKLPAPKLLREVTGENGFGDDELTYEDQWPDAYLGKTYGHQLEHPAGQGSELFTTAIQDLFGRDEHWVKAGPAGIRFVLGSLALLGRGGDRD